MNKTKAPINLGKIIDRAAKLIHDGYPQGIVSPGKWQCWSQRFGEELIYDVTTLTCTCWMGENRRSIICKHRWASVAPLMVAFISDLREASSIEGLKYIVEVYDGVLGTTHEKYRQYARVEYREREAILKEEAAAEEAA